MKRTQLFYVRQAASILRQIQYVTVASITTDGRPWNSPVRAVFDDKLNCYWFSDKEGQHSYNIRENGNVFLVVYDSTVPEGSGVGVYIEATAHEVTDLEEIVRARRLKREGLRADSNEFLGLAVRRVYRASPQRVWTNDTQRARGTFVRDFRVKLDLQKLRRAVFR